MVFLENDTFLTELTKLFQRSKSKGSGSVYVTMKKYDGKTKPDKNPNAKPLPKKIAKARAAAAAAKKDKPSQEPPPSGCLVRASLQNRKISTVVPAQDVNRFQLSYCSVLRGNMDALKKVKKSKNKAKATS